MYCLLLPQSFKLEKCQREVCNSFRAYKMLYYVILDAVCLVMFLVIMNSKTVDEEILVPEDFDNKTNKEKAEWIDGISRQILKKWFFLKNQMIFVKIWGRLFQILIIMITTGSQICKTMGVSNATIVTRHTSTAIPCSIIKKNIMMPILKSQSQSKEKVAQMKLTSTYLCYFDWHFCWKI